MNLEMDDCTARIMRAEYLLRHVCAEAIEEFGADFDSSAAAASILPEQNLLFDKIVTYDSDGDLDVNWGVKISAQDDSDYCRLIRISDDADLLGLLSKAIHAPDRLNGVVEYIADQWDDAEHLAYLNQRQADSRDRLGFVIPGHESIELGRWLAVRSRGCVNQTRGSTSFNLAPFRDTQLAVNSSHFVSSRQTTCCFLTRVTVEGSARPRGTNTYP